MTDLSKTFAAFTDAEISTYNSAYTAKLGGDPGTTGIVNSPTPMTNLFGRLDFQANQSNRIVARLNYTNATNNNRRQNSRSATQAVLETNFHAINSRKIAPVVQWFSNLKNGFSKPS